MKIQSNLSYFEPGMTASLRAMHLQTELMGIASENINGFDKVGYQRKEAVVSSFTEFMGVHALSTTVDDEPGRISVSQNPLDLALSNKGYFRVLGKDGIKLTRDGRFHYDKDGNFLTLQNEKVLAQDGTPIVFSVVPPSPDKVKIGLDGSIKVFDVNANKMVNIGSLSVVSTEGAAVLDPGVRQGYTENSNVSLNEEFMTALPIKRNFDANRIIFQQQQQLISNTIQQMTNM